MRVRSRFVWMIAVASMFMAARAPAAASKEDIEAVASKALGWALADGLKGAKALAASPKINVIDYNLPAGTALTVPGRTISVTSLIRLQAAADLSESRPAFIFSSIAIRDQTAKVSISLKLVASVKTDPNPPEVEGAVLKLERGTEGWEVTAVNDRWP